MMLIEVISVTARDTVSRAIAARRHKPFIAVFFRSAARRSKNVSRRRSRRAFDLAAIPGVGAGCSYGNL